MALAAARSSPLEGLGGRAAAGAARRCVVAGVARPAALAQPSNNVVPAPKAKAAARELVVSSPSAAAPSAGASLKERLAAEAARALAAEDSWHTQPGPPNLVDAASPAGFKAAVLGAPRGGLVVADYYSPSCAACRAMWPKLRQIAERNPDVLFVKVNAGGGAALAQLAAGMGAERLPTFQFFRDGAVLASFTANLSTIGKLRAEISAHKACDDPLCGAD